MVFGPNVGAVSPVSSPIVTEDLWTVLYSREKIVDEPGQLLIG
jgi:hypothetical protein